MLKVREKAEKDRALLNAGQKQIEMTRTGNLVEVAKETKPVDLNEVLNNADISDKGKDLLRRVIGR